MSGVNTYRDALLGRTLRALLLGDDDSKDAPIEVAYADATGLMSSAGDRGHRTDTETADRLYNFIGSIRAALHEGEDPAAEEIAKDAS